MVRYSCAGRNTCFALAKTKVFRRITRSVAFVSNNWPNFTPRAQKALALARSEAEGLGNNYISAEHLFLGMLALAEGGDPEVGKSTL